MPATGDPLVSNGLSRSGTTANRPTNASRGQQYFDTTLGMDLVFNNTEWQLPDGTIPTARTPGAPAGTGVTAVQASPNIQCTVLTLASTVINMVDGTTNGCHGNQKVYDFPAGNILILGATTDLTVAAGVGGITDTASVVAAIGTTATATDNATLTTTEANIVPSTAATLTGGNGSMKGESTGVVTLDGTATAVDAFLNIAVPDAGSSANDTVTVSGTIRLVWVNLGDN